MSLILTVIPNLSGQKGETAVFDHPVSIWPRLYLNYENASQYDICESLLAQGRKKNTEGRPQEGVNKAHVG
jgi:hypothetical protein